ncbi:hypothetical protein GBF38_015691, partial [Nibea albiflora]
DTRLVSVRLVVKRVSWQLSLLDASSAAGSAESFISNIFEEVCEDDSSLSSEEEAEMSEPTWLAADLGAASDLSPPSRGERMRHSPQNTHSKEDDGKDDTALNCLSSTTYRLKSAADESLRHT